MTFEKGTICFGFYEERGNSDIEGLSTIHLIQGSYTSHHLYSGYCCIGNKTVLKTLCFKTKNEALEVIRKRIMKEIEMVEKWSK
jgi:hypothetical protein